MLWYYIIHIYSIAVSYNADTLYHSYSSYSDLGSWKASCKSSSSLIWSVHAARSSSCDRVTISSYVQRTSQVGAVKEMSLSSSLHQSRWGAGYLRKPFHLGKCVYNSGSEIRKKIEIYHLVQRGTDNVEESDMGSNQNRINNDSSAASPGVRHDVWPPLYSASTQA